MHTQLARAEQIDLFEEGAGQLGQSGLRAGQAGAVGRPRGGEGSKGQGENEQAKQDRGRHGPWYAAPGSLARDPDRCTKIVAHRRPRRQVERTMGRIVHSDNLEVLAGLPDDSLPLIVVDPPFNTGQERSRESIRVERDEEGDRAGFPRAALPHGTHRHEFLRGRLRGLLGFSRASAWTRCAECSPARGSLFVHLDWREVHYVKVLLDRLFGRASFMNEIVWAYDYGARSKSRWPTKHDSILWYAKDPKHYTFHYDAMDRIPYMAPGLVGREKAARGKTPTDVWWHTIVSPTGKEKTGYPTQKPLGVLERIVKVHSNPGELVADFFAGSGTTGEAAARNERDFLLVDSNPEAVRVMAERLAPWDPIVEELDSGQVETSAGPRP